MPTDSNSFRDKLRQIKDGAKAAADATQRSAANAEQTLKQMIAACNQATQRLGQEVVLPMMTEMAVELAENPRAEAERNGKNINSAYFPQKFGAMRQDVVFGLPLKRSNVPHYQVCVCLQPLESPEGNILISTSLRDDRDGEKCIGNITISATAPDDVVREKLQPELEKLFAEALKMI